MLKSRLEAFSDGVLAIIITIMVLALQVPKEPSWQAIVALWPIFLSYALSFLFVGIYWNNHHHLFQAARSITGGVLWANLHLLFWLSLLPFTTAWMGENEFARIPMLLYGLDLLLCALAYYILQLQLAVHHGPQSAFTQALGRDVKGKASLVLNLAGLAATWFVSPWLGFATFTIVALLWLIPDSRMVRAYNEHVTADEARKETTH
ncbi:MAG: TMEM175 family protein [Flavobacteriales bacterium]